VRTPSHYDRDYFDRWYRDPRHRVFTTVERARRSALAIAATEYVLQRRIRTVLDVGAGEGHWREPLLRQRPRLKYIGLDPSPYVVRRFGRLRNIREGSVETVDAGELGGPFDLVLAVGFLNLLSRQALVMALKRLRTVTSGVALLELFSARDPLDGDISRYTRLPASVYRGCAKRAGFIPIGFHLYAAGNAAQDLAQLERF
jgi:SAM-dependent methyltransferase